jgi:tRNA modification GTPase
MQDTIFALSSGGLPSGIAVIRISGPQSRVAVETMCDIFEFSSGVVLSNILNPDSSELLDKALVLTFVSPNSFTGEDVVEFQVHGGKAVVDGIIQVLAGLNNFRMAEPGEFTYRAFENGKLDLTQAEGIADLIASESENQRKLALENIGGDARKQVDDWANRLLKMRALIEAEIDFVDEDDIPGSVSDQVWDNALILLHELENHVDAIRTGEIIRDGYRVTLLGKPNAGKSTLLNCLAKREAAIVSDEPGTTRDIVEVKLNIDGQIVYVSDTAGIRNTSSKVEQEGVRRARAAAGTADMNIWLHSADDNSMPELSDIECDFSVLSKSEKTGDVGSALKIFNLDFGISVFENSGIEQIVERICGGLESSLSANSHNYFSRERQASYLKDAVRYLNMSVKNHDQPLELRAEYLRNSAIAIGMITGRPDTEDILGSIFSEFCVGK